MKLLIIILNELCKSLSLVNIKFVNTHYDLNEEELKTLLYKRKN